MAFNISSIFGSDEFHDLSGNGHGESRVLENRTAAC